MEGKQRCRSHKEYEYTQKTDLYLDTVFPAHKSASAQI
jgi:hypothetical protein